MLVKLKVNRSPGIDELSPKLLKELAEELTEPVTMLYRTSLAESELPEDWLKSVISTIYKTGKKCLAENCRPVSLTCILCKGMETMIRDHIVNHMLDNNLFSPCQYGFLAKRSTTLQLLKALDDWTEALDNGFEVDVIYTDFQKAFDKVPHQRLLGKMKAYGISQEIIDWTAKFITQRKQKVVINGESSSWKKVTSGVPQGSVLGPILFVIYINDLPEITLSKLLLFADDSKIYRQIRNVMDQIDMQTDLHRMFLWSEKWLRKFHPGKLKKLTISTGRKEDEYRTYFVGPMRVKETECEKDLGVKVDNSLNFKQHIAAKVKTANGMVGAVRRSFRYLDVPTFRLLFKGLVRHHLEYAVNVWTPYHETQIDKIEGVQKRATSMLPEMKGLEYEERLKVIGLPLLKHRRNRADMIELYKIIDHKYDQSLCPNIIMRKEITLKESRLNSHALFQSRCTKELRKNYFSQRATPIWNSLPEKVVNATSTESFKVNLDKHWANQPAVFNHKCHLT